MVDAHTHTHAGAATEKIITCKIKKKKTVYYIQFSHPSRGRKVFFSGKKKTRAMCRHQISDDTEELEGPGGGREGVRPR